MTESQTIHVAQKKKRHINTIKKNLPLIFKAICIAAIFSFLQYWISYFHFSFKKEDENPILFITIVFSFFAYVIFAGYAVMKVLEQSTEISFAIIEGKLETFLLYRDERLPYLSYLPMGASALVFTVAVLFFPYGGKLIGIMTVFPVVFLLVIFYLIIKEIDRFEHSTWFREATPEDWWSIDPQAYFTKKKSKG